MSTKPPLTSRVAERVAGQSADQAAARPDTEPQTPPVPAEVDLAQSDQLLKWLMARRSYFAAALPRHIDEHQFIQAALTAMHKTPQLQKCEPASLMLALMSCAKFGLDPDGVHSAIVPYGKTATFVPMYMGYIELMYRSGMVESVVFDFVRDGDAWTFDQGKRPPEDFFHRPDLLSSEVREPLLAYAFAWMKSGGRSQVIFLNRAEAEEIRDTRSKAYQLAERNRRDYAKDFQNSPSKGKFNSTWHTDFDAMWLKSAVRRLVKRVPTSPEIRDLLKLDDQLDMIEQLQSSLQGAIVQPEQPSVESEAQPAIAPPGPADDPEPEDEAGWPPVRRPGNSAEGEAS